MTPGLRNLLLVLCVLWGLTAALPVLSVPLQSSAPAYQTWDQAEAASESCVQCHTETDQLTMHADPGVVLGCTDCHGGDATVSVPEEDTPGWRRAMSAAHVRPRVLPADSANPVRSYTALNRESQAYIRFINPSDYRVVRAACGACHLPTIQATERSLMSTSAMLWGGGAYNNGVLPFKNYILGEAYTSLGEPAAIPGLTAVSDVLRRRGVLPMLLPLPAWETVPPGDNFRTFEAGREGGSSAIFPELALPDPDGPHQPGKPDLRASNRGPGTGLRVAGPVLNLHKTRLNDPNMWFLGTNDQPGDYRSSGCAACHVVYANDRDPRHSGPYAAAGHHGQSQSVDPMISKEDSGHPLKHAFTRAIPTSQCMVCHMHQPNVFVNSFLGYTMWDYEADAPQMWPEEQQFPSAKERRAVLERNPEGAAPRGKWADEEFLSAVSEQNDQLSDTQFADYHGHGWNFRAIFKRDRAGNLLDEAGEIVSNDDPEKFDKAVHMSSIHLDRGMHCVDCHFSGDGHGNGYIYGEVAAAVEISCIDCHGSAEAYPTLQTSGPAAVDGGLDLTSLTTPDGRRRFIWEDGQLIQRSSLWPDRQWTVSLVKDSVNPDHTDYNPHAARAKLMSDDGSMRWGPGVESVAHGPDEMACFTCHLSWTTSCAGCHLNSEANEATESHHYDGDDKTRSYATYNPQVVRDQMFQLGRHGSVKDNIIAPVRSSSALVISVTNANRERLVTQQPPISSAGYSSQAFAPHFPHTVRKTETKTCSDCHLSADNDNNAIMAQLLLQGTDFVSFVGFHAWLGAAGGVQAVQVTEWDEPQAVIGSYLHRYAYPKWYQQHLLRDRELTTTHDHAAPGDVRCLQHRGEYLYAATADGLQVFDIAAVGNKGFSQPLNTGQYSALGQQLAVPSAQATCVALPTNQPIRPSWNRRALILEDNQEQPMHPVYDYVALTDAEEGLILIPFEVLADGDPTNNQLQRALTWSADGRLADARHITFGGHLAYISTPRGIAIVDLDDPLKPALLAEVDLPGARAVALQFRYLFVAAEDGLHVVDVTNPAAPVPAAHLPLAEAWRVYVARTYAYVAAGAQGLVIVNVENPERPEIHTTLDTEDARDVVVGSTNASLYAYVADGAAGLKVVQLTSPESQPNFYGFSPPPQPTLIATRQTRWPALALSSGLERDRAVDETGHQIAVMGRLGSRPFTLPEMQRLYLNTEGRIWTVQDEVDLSRFVP